MTALEVVGVARGIGERGRFAVNPDGTAVAFWKNGGWALVAKRLFLGSVTWTWVGVADTTQYEDCGPWEEV